MKRFADRDQIISRTRCAEIDAAIKLVKERKGLYSDYELTRKLGHLVPTAGSVVGSFGDGMVQVLDSDSHDAVVAASGRKKSRAWAIPSVITYVLSGAPFVVNDMKGEVFAAVKALLDFMDYKTIVLDYRKPESSPNCFNLLSAAWYHFKAGDHDAAARVIRNVAETLYSELGSKTKDVYWTNMAIEYFSGLALGLLEIGCPLDEFTIESVFEADAIGSTELKRVFSELKGTVAEKNASGTLMAPNDTQASIRSVFAAPLSAFCSQERLMDMMSRSDFLMSDLANEKTALFIISPDESAGVAPIVTAVFSQLMSELVSLAGSSGGSLANPVHILLDEFGNLKRIPNFEHIVSAGRSRGLRLHLVLQSTSQLSYVYGEDIKEVITSNIYNWIFMGFRDVHFLKEFSEQLGVTIRPSGQEKPLLSVSALGMLEKRPEESEAICLVEDIPPYLATMLDYSVFEELPSANAIEQIAHPSIKRRAFDVKGAADVLRRQRIERIIGKENLPKAPFLTDD